MIDINVAKIKMLTKKVTKAVKMPKNLSFFLNSKKSKKLRKIIKKLIIPMNKKSTFPPSRRIPALSQ